LLSDGALQAPGAPAQGMVVCTSTPAANDTFWSNESGLVSAFDFNYEEIIDFETKIAWARFAFIPPAWISCVCCVPCYLNQNVGWKARAQHVALTVDGIRYVTDKRKSLCGLPCSDVGKESKTVPYDKITDCDVTEPAGAACCCCIPRTLSTVRVDTASSGAVKEGGVTHELELKGLRFPNEFKQAVWAYKRGQAPANASVPLGILPPTLAAPQQSSMNNDVLVQILDELRRMNSHMEARDAGTRESR